MAAVLGAAAPAASQVPPPPGGDCHVTNPPNGESPNPCGIYVDESWGYTARGDWEIHVEHRDGTAEILSSEAGDPASGGPGVFRHQDYVTSRAITPGSSVLTRDSDETAPDVPRPPGRWPASRYVRDAAGDVRAQDGTRIRYQIVLPAGASAERPVPLVIAAHGWSGHRGMYSTAWGWPAHALAGGYAVLTYDARGHGESGGQAELNHPDFEGADVSALIDRVAADARIAKDAEGDPRVGMVGGSYGGAVQYLAAARDDRIDAIVPDVTWNDLYDALFPRGVYRAPWTVSLTALGQLNTLYQGFWHLEFDRWEFGSINPVIPTGFATAAATGDVSPELRAWLRERGPAHLLEDFDTPTMILHGEQDTLFAPSQAVATFDALRRNLPGEKLRMRWYCGGHGTCKPNYFEWLDELDRTYRDGMRFLDRWVKGDEAADVGPTFAYMTQDGRWHDAPHFPPKPTGALRASGTGTLTAGGEPSTGFLVDTPARRLFLPPRPAQTSLKIDIPHGDGTIVGAGQVTLTAAGTGSGTDTGRAATVFLRLIDKRTQTVVGNQTTPVVLPTDGLPHTTSLSLEPVVWKLGAKDRLALEILGTSEDFEPQRGAALIDLRRVDVVLPVTAAR